jgi:hypothetical protein
MAAEATIIELIGKVPGCPVRFTVLDASTIAKGALLELTTATIRQVITHSGADKPIVGIAAHEKVALDGSTTITAYTNGIFDMTAAAAGATDVGHMVAGSATVNMFTPADANDLLQGSFIGNALEAVDNDERAAIRVLTQHIGG